MSFNPFVGFPAAIPHFAVGKFQQSQEASFVSIPSSQSLQIAVTTVDPSHLNHVNNGHHVPTSSSLQIQNQMLNNLLSKTGQQNESVFVKVEHHEAEENRQRFLQASAEHEKNNGPNVQQEIGSLNEYLSR